MKPTYHLESSRHQPPNRATPMRSLQHGRQLLLSSRPRSESTWYLAQSCNHGSRSEQTPHPDSHSWVDHSCPELTNQLHEPPSACPDKALNQDPQASSLFYEEAWGSTRLSVTLKTCLSSSQPFLHEHNIQATKKMLRIEGFI